MVEKGPDIVKMSLIRGILQKYKEGLWIRELARKAKMSRSTVSRYINDYLKYEVETDTIGPLKLVRLKKHK